MRKTYTAPEGTVILLMAEENLAALEGHASGDVMTMSDDTPTSSTVVGGDRPF